MPTPELSRRTLVGLLAAFPGLALAQDDAPHAALGGFLDPAPRESDTPTAFTLSNATVLDHRGVVHAGHGVRVEGGRIVEVGAQVTGGTDLGGDWLCPGFTDACSHLGLFEIGAESGTRDDGDTSAITPDARAWDGYNPFTASVAVARVEGVTHTIVAPSLSRLVAGQAGLMRTAGRTVDDALLRGPVALCVSIGHRGLGGDGAPSSRIGVMRSLRALIDDAPEPRQLQARGGRRKDAADDSELSAADRVLQQARERRFKVMVRADRADDIERALDWLDSSGLDGVLLGCAEGWMVADLLSDAAIPVVLGPVLPQPNTFEHPHARYDNAAILDAAGVPLSFATMSNHDVRKLRTDVGVLTAHGLSAEAAIRGLTTGAAEAFAIPRLGRMAKGGRASFFRATGHPLQPRTQIKAVWIGGRRTSMTTRQSELFDRFRRL